MSTALFRLASTLLLVGVSSDDDEQARIRKAATNLVALLVVGLSPIWVGTYLLLDRPLPAAIPGSYALFSLLCLAWIASGRTVPGFTQMQLVLFAALPVALQWSLGGFVHGAAVALWAVAAPLLALVVYGSRAAWRWFACFVVTIIVSGLFESALHDATEPLPSAVQTAFFVLDVIAPVTAIHMLLAYFVRQRDAAEARTENLLLHILPAAIADRLKAGEAQIADRHESATVLFADIVDFTAFADATPPERIVALLGRAFVELDALAAKHGLEKIKTLGDGYLAVAGVTTPRPDHALAATAMALELESTLVGALAEDWPTLRMRVGLATGPVMAGVIGTQRFSFDVWGDTVNTASRMASLAEPGAVQVTQTTCDAISHRYRTRRHDDVEVKGKGRMTTYVVLGPL